MNKKNLREQILAIRKSLSVDKVESYSDIIMNNLITSELYKKATNIMSYVSFNNEVNTHKFIKKAIEDGKKISVPYIDSKNKIMMPCLIDDISELVSGYFGILSPDPNKLKIIDEKSIDLVIVPGAVFDISGYRIGYGGGYYDKFLPLLRKDALSVGLAFSFQVIDKVPFEKYDIPVDFIITEKDFIECEVRNA
ncbi:MAG TPA: 5-formyltetrahydrofolate cyclo-ligase [Soehngenia sp.]|nr:5-formyltetrahydrofolate cyclo-ligase [Soehngenia sp.]HPP30879.1 5-formyltetrahydrofolate cyclo-ligase [Soehngenia sp.]